MIPKQIGRYQIRGELGRGGMATVFHGYDPHFEREVAIKVLPRQFLHDPTFRKRFRREARTIAQLERLAVVPVYDFGEENGQPYLVMSLMRGGSLAERIAQRSLLLAEAARILSALAATLDEGHRQGIIHRDLKPANILFDEHGKPYIADFGIAKLTIATQSFSMTGGIIGTPQYMSPEQWEGQPLDGRSDVYALGVILFQMLAGQCPYEGTTPGSIMKKHLINPVPNILALRGDLPASIQPIIEHAMSKERHNRYATASAFTQALDSLVIGASAPPTEKLDHPHPLPVDNHWHQQPTGGSGRAGGRASATNRPISPLEKLSTQKWLLGGLSVLAITLVSFLIIIAVGLSSDNNNPSDDASPPVIAEADTPIPPTETPVPALVAGATRVVEDGMVQVYVPEGEFLMGASEDDEEAGSDEKPQHTVNLDAYWIDRTEVTNEMFGRFVEQTSYQTDAEKEGTGWVCADGSCDETDGADWQHPQGPESNLNGLETHPVVQVSWNDASAYCEWAGKRLPTEAEWEKAARGTDGRKYPWGEQAPTGELANFCDANCAWSSADESVDDGYALTAPVGNYPAGATPYGALDMAGNVWEWVNDFYDDNYYAISPRDNPLGASVEAPRVLRGGSWYDVARYLCAPVRGWDVASDRYDSLGFRCAASDS